MSSDATVLDPNFGTVMDNIEFLEGGQRKKRLGLQVYSTSTSHTTTGAMISTSTPVRAAVDFWRYGASLTPTQHLVAVSGASLFYSTGNGKWTTLNGAASSFGASTNINTMITIAGDYAVISDESATPIAYNQSTLKDSQTATEGGSTWALWPRFTGSRYHLDRLFMWGISTSPSRVHYTAAGNIFDTTSTGSSFKIAEGDGDRVIGASKPFYASMYFFKGPQYGSLWQLSGVGSTDFAMVQVGYGAPLVNQRAVVTTPSDIFWMSQYGIHSLQTTVKYGNVEEAFLSLPIQKLWREGLIRRDRLDETWAFWHPQRSIVGWAVVPAGETTHRWLLMYNYALSDPKPGGKKFWAIWKFNNNDLTCGDTFLIPGTWNTLVSRNRAGQPAPILGDANGNVFVNDWTGLSDYGNAYTATVRTPVLTRFATDRQQLIPETQEKGFVGIVTYFNPTAAVSADVSVWVDRRLQSTTISLAGGGATLT